MHRGMRDFLNDLRRAYWGRRGRPHSPLTESPNHLGLKEGRGGSWGPGRACGAGGSTLPSVRPFCL